MQQLTPDVGKFVASLDDAQAAFLYVELQAIKGQKLYKLREALAERVLGTPSQGGSLRQQMVHKFYSPDAPIVAVPVYGPRPKKRRR